MGKFLAAILFLLASTSQAGYYDSPWRVEFGGWSKHLVSNQFGDEPWNEDHEMIGIAYKKVSVNYFKNSYGEDAIGVGYDFEWKSLWGVEAGIYAALWSGYEDVPVNIGGVIPVVSPYVKVEYKKCGVKTLVNPVVVAAWATCQLPEWKRKRR